MIHICFGLHDETGHYSKFTGTAICSIFENAKAPSQSILIHILHDNTLTYDNCDKFNYLAGKYNQLVKFYNVEELCPDKVQKMIEIVPQVQTSRVSVGAFYRLLIAELLPTDIEKIIYFDSDIIVNLDIAELWQIELDDKPLAAVTEISNGVDSATWFDLCRDGFVKAEDYFNSGVMIINLKFLRTAAEIIFDGIKFRGKHTNYSFFDQTVWNYCFSTQALKLPTKFNRFVRWVRKSEETVERKIYHYTVHALRFDMEDIFNLLWLKYFFKTPFFEVESIGRLWSKFEQIRNDLEKTRLKISAIISGKTRAFFIAPEEIEETRKIFKIRAAELIIPAEDEGSLKN